MQNAIAEIISTMTENVQALEALGESLKGQDLGAVYVLENQGFFVCVESGKASACGLIGASRHTQAEALKLARIVKNGNNHPARALPLGEALAHELAQARETLADIEARAASL